MIFPGKVECKTVLIRENPCLIWIQEWIKEGLRRKRAFANKRADKSFLPFPPQILTKVGAGVLPFRDPWGWSSVGEGFSGPFSTPVPKPQLAPGHTLLKSLQQLHTVSRIILPFPLGSELFTLSSWNPPDSLLFPVNYLHLLGLVP